MCKRRILFYSAIVQYLEKNLIQILVVNAIQIMNTNI